MRRLGSLLLLAAIAIVAGGQIALADLSFTFTAVPASGNIEGPAGSTIGWGYSITNDSSTDWLVTTNLAAGVFQNGTPDASLFDFPIVSPLTTVTVPYDQSTGSGLFGLAWNSSAPSAFVNSGSFTLSAEWFTGNPLTTGTDTGISGNEIAAYSATVSSPVSTVPEPNFSVLIAAALLLLCLGKSNNFRGILRLARQTRETKA
jgi:hypothetical protein